MPSKASSILGQLVHRIPPLFLYKVNQLTNLHHYPLYKSTAGSTGPHRTIKGSLLSSYRGASPSPSLPSPLRTWSHGREVHQPPPV